MNGLDALDVFDFGILLQALANNMKTGMLAVRSENRVKYLQLDKNKLVAIYTARPKVSLGRVLYNHRAIEKAQLRDATDAVLGGDTGGSLGEHLADKSIVTRQQMRRAAHYQLIEETLELFYWKNVGFKFVSGGTQATLEEKNLVPVGEPMDVEALLLQCTKAIDDIAKFDEVTPSLRDVYELHVDSLETLNELVPDPAQREFVLLIDGVRDMRDVLRDMRMNRFEVLEFFYRFRREGWIRPKNAFELLMLAENRKKEFTLDKRARVYERINELGVEGFEVLLPLAETYEELGTNDKAAALFAKHARRCAEGGDLKGALLAASRAAKLLPDDLELRVFEIDLLLKNDRSEDAGVAYLALAAIREKSGDGASALAALKSAAKLHPSDATNWRRLADLLLKTGRTRRAAAALRRAGDATLASGDAADAVSAWRAAAEHCRGAWSLRYRLVRTLHDAGQDDVAVQEISELIQILVDDSAPLASEARMRHLERVEECLRLAGGMTSSAATALGRAFAQFDGKDHAVAVFRAAADALGLAKRHRGAVETLEELIELAPDDIAARRDLARSHLALGDVNRAVTQLRRAGQMLTADSRWPEARDVYQEMVGADPGCADAHAGLANALRELGETSMASKHFHRAALLHRGGGAVDVAAQFFREAVDRNPTDADLLDEYCELLLTTDRRSETLQALSALVELRMSQRTPARASIAITRILEIDPHYPGAKKILEEAAQQLLRVAEVTDEIDSDEIRVVLESVRAQKPV
jgi:tetratricopeptide (TPR) repeat protein